MGGGEDLARYGQRVGATLLDLGLISLIATTAVVLSGVELEAANPIIVAVVVLATLVYATPLLCRKGRRNGQTLGKQVLRIRAVRQDAEPMTASTALLREFVGKGLLGLVPFFTVVDFLFPLSDPRRQAIHDKLASTFVVQADAVPELDPVVEPSLGGFEPPSP